MDPAPTDGEVVPSGARRGGNDNKPSALIFADCEGDPRSRRDPPDGVGAVEPSNDRDGASSRPSGNAVDIGDNALFECPSRRVETGFVPPSELADESVAESSATSRHAAPPSKGNPKAFSCIFHLIPGLLASRHTVEETGDAGSAGASGRKRRGPRLAAASAVCRNTHRTHNAMHTMSTLELLPPSTLAGDEPLAVNSPHLGSARASSQ